MNLNGIPISDDQCIGDSLQYINSAFQTLSTNVLTLSGSTSLVIILDKVSTGFFNKDDSSIVAWKKTADSAVSTQTDINVNVNGTVLTFLSGTSVSMPSTTAGTDYAIWANPNGTLQATTSHTSPPVLGSRKVGGFHYAPGSNATAQAGGNATPQINQYSFWDLKFRPNCPDPRGMTLVADSFWSDIYLCGVDHPTNGTSKYNVPIADGSTPPKIPIKFGGNGNTAYTDGNWWNFMEVLQSHGKRGFSEAEFAAAAFGTTEATSSGGLDVPTTGVTGTGGLAWNTFTSKWGVIQSTGCLFIWGDELAKGYAVWLGGASYAPPAGSRHSDWNFAQTRGDGSSTGVRGACDHLSHD